MHMPLQPLALARPSLVPGDLRTRAVASVLALLPAALAAAGDCAVTLSDDFTPPSSGTTIGAAVLSDVGGFPRLKLVSDFQPSSWGTWVLVPEPAVEGSIESFRASFRVSFKNEGGPGDGFSFMFGDLSNLEGNRAEGGEWGFNAFGIDGEGLTVGFVAYPGAGGNGLNVKRGGSGVAFTPYDFSPFTYSDYVQAGDPVSMPTVTVDWSRSSGVTVRVALPFQPPVTVLDSVGAGDLADMATEGWGFGFAGRNGGIDMDVLIGDLSIEVDPACPATPGDLDGNGVVDGADLSILLSGWGACPKKGACAADIDGDGMVGGSDLSILLGNWTGP